MMTQLSNLQWNLSLLPKDSKHFLVRAKVALSSRWGELAEENGEAM